MVLQPLRNVAGVTIMDAQTISIQPWDRGVLRDISKAITEANLGLNPQDNGESVMIKVPTLTEERRRDLVKMAGKNGRGCEDCYQKHTTRLYEKN